METYYDSRSKILYAGGELEDSRPDEHYLVGVTPEGVEIARPHPNTIAGYKEENKPVSPLLPIPDAKWISKFILKKVKDGSIVLIHMPERGVREWNFEAMELTLKGLKEKGYNIVTFSRLHELSQ